MSSSSPSGRPRKTLGPSPIRDRRRRSTSSCGTPAVGDVGRDHERKVDDSAPRRPVPVVVYVPLRVERTAHAEGSARLAVISEMESRRERPGICSDLVHSSNGTNRCLCTGSAIPRRAPATQEFAEIVRQSLRVKQRGLKQFEDLALPGLLVVAVVVVRLGYVGGVEFKTQLFVGDRPAGSGRSREQPGGSDDSEPIRWVGDLRHGLWLLRVTRRQLRCSVPASGRSAAASGSCPASPASTRRPSSAR